MSAKRPNTIDWIAVTILITFVGIWVAVLAHTWTSFVPGSTEPIEISDGISAAAGAVTTLIATRTASVLGFAIKRIDSDAKTALTPGSIAASLNWAVRWAIYAYLLVGVAIITNWLALGSQSPELVAAYALGVFGWLGGATGVVFAGGADARTS